MKRLPLTIEEKVLVIDTLCEHGVYSVVELLEIILRDWKYRDLIDKDRLEKLEEILDRLDQAGF